MTLNLESARYYSGLGDIVLLAWIAAGCRGASHSLRFHRTRDLELMGLLGLDVDSQPGGVCLDEVFAREVAEGGRRPRIDYIREFLGIPASPARPELRLTAADVAWADDRSKELGRPLVLLFPQAAWKPREWPANYWVDLAWGLQANGAKVLVLLANDDARFHNTPEFQWNTPVGRLAALMRRADLVIGNDSFPAHLAGTAGTPTLALLGPTQPTVFAHIPEVECVMSRRLDCTGCHFNPPFRAACDQGCLSLYRLFPEDVLPIALRRIGIGTGSQA